MLKSEMRCAGCSHLPSVFSFMINMILCLPIIIWVAVLVRVLATCQSPAESLPVLRDTGSLLKLSSLICFHVVVHLLF